MLIMVGASRPPTPSFPVPHKVASQLAKQTMLSQVGVLSGPIAITMVSFGDFASAFCMVFT